MQGPALAGFPLGERDLLRSASPERIPRVLGSCNLGTPKGAFLLLATLAGFGGIAITVAIVLPVKAPSPMRRPLNGPRWPAPDGRCDAPALVFCWDFSAPGFAAFAAC